MTEEKDELGAWFSRYAEGFLNGEDDFDRSIRLKIEHSFRVRREAMSIAAAEHLPPTVSRLIDTAAMLHDIGRFEQFRRFRTFNDDESVDHGALGARLLVKSGPRLSSIPAERGMILAAVRCHNAVAIPRQLGGEARQVAMVVRDADKLDILPILLGYLDRADNGDVIWNLTDGDRLTPEVRDCLLRRQSPRHRDFHTAADFVASKMGWVYDLNCRHTCVEFIRRNYLGRLLRHLPDTPEISEIFALASGELESRRMR